MGEQKRFPLKEKMSPSAKLTVRPDLHRLGDNGGGSRDVECFDLITALATTSIAVLTFFYVRYSRQELDAIRTQFHLDHHRPWVWVSKSRLSAEPGSDTKAPISIKLWVRNTGNTPAFIEIYQGKMRISASPEMPKQKTTTVQANAGVVGHIRDWLHRGFTKTAQPGTTSENSTVQVVPPGTTSETFVTLQDVDDSVRDQSKIDAYNKRKLNLYFQGEIRYSDSARDEHATSVCTYHAHGWRLSDFNPCPNGNGMDIEPGWADKGSGKH